VEQLVEWKLTVKTEVLGGKPPQCHYVQYKSRYILIWTRTRAASSCETENNRVIMRFNSWTAIFLNMKWKKLIPKHNIFTHSVTFQHSQMKFGTRTLEISKIGEIPQPGQRLGTGMDNQEGQDSIPGKDKNFLYSTAFKDRHWGPPSLSYNELKSRKNKGHFIRRHWPMRIPVHT
jgi:hypothetical protein